MKLRERKTIDTRLHEVYFFLWDGMYDLVPKWRWLYDFLGWGIEDPALWFLCKIYGHEATRDQCGKPEHDLCIWCRTSMPYMAEGSDDSAFRVS